MDTPPRLLHRLQRFFDRTGSSHAAASSGARRPGAGVQVPIFSLLTRDGAWTHESCFNIQCRGGFQEGSPLPADADIWKSSCVSAQGSHQHVRKAASMLSDVLYHLISRLKSMTQARRSSYRGLQLHNMLGLEIGRLRNTGKGMPK